MGDEDLDELPRWEDGTVAILSTGGAAPHAIPVSTGVRAGPRRLVFALARRRESLARLREEPSVALTVMAAGDVVFTAHGRATIVAEPLVVDDNVVAVALEVERIQDHGQAQSAIEQGVRWRWTDEQARARDKAVRAALGELAR